MDFETDDGKEYWVGLDNFYAIMRYNPRTKYAMAVYQLSEAIRERYAAVGTGAGCRLSSDPWDLTSYARCSGPGASLIALIAAWLGGCGSRAGATPTRRTAPASTAT